MIVAAPHANTCISVRLSPWAPDCIDLPWADPRLSRRYWSTPLVKVIASLLRRLGRAPDEITVEACAEDDVAIIGPVPPEHDPYSYRTGILAMLWGDVSRAQTVAEVERLIAAGWKPAAWTSPGRSGDVVSLNDHRQAVEAR